MARAIAQVSMNRKGQVPEDVVVNTWHFESDDAFSAGQDNLAGRLADFYTAGNAWWGAILDGTGRIKIYDYDDPKPRVPKVDVAMSVSPGGGSLPAELCICLSMSADVESGQVKARRRGRVYLGPLSTGTPAILGSTDKDVRVASATRTAILDATEALANANQGGFRMAVFSPRTKELGGTDDQAWNDVTFAWVDDAFDIQRRRGSRPSLRAGVDI